MWQVLMRQQTLRLGQGNSQRLHIGQVDGPDHIAIIMRQRLVRCGKMIPLATCSIWAVRWGTVIAGTVRVLYLDLNLDFLPPFGGNVAAFLVKTMRCTLTHTDKRDPAHLAEHSTKCHLGRRIL